MGQVIAFGRQGYVVRPSVALLPLSAPTAVADPQVGAQLRHAGLDPAAIRWGEGVTLVAPLFAAEGRVVRVDARADGAVMALHLLAIGLPPATVTEAGGHAELELPVRKAQRVAAVAVGADGSARGVLAEIRLA